MESGFKKRNPVKTFPMKDEIGVFCRCVLLYTKPPGKTSAPPLDVQLYAGEVHDIVKSVCKISRKNLASGQTQQNFSFIQAAKASGRAKYGEREVSKRLRPGKLRASAERRGTTIERANTPESVAGRADFQVGLEPKQDD